MQSLLFIFSILVILMQGAFANPAQTLSPFAPTPTTCVSGDFTASGDNYWQFITLKLSNNCNKTVDFQNASISFENKIELNTNLWGDFAPLSYPDNDLRMTSQKLPNGNYLASFSLHFPSYYGANSKLPAGQAIFIKFGAPSAGQLEGSARVYLGSPVTTGSIQLMNTSAKPASVSQNYALVHLTANGQEITQIQLPWQSSQIISGLNAGSYNLSVDNINDSSGDTYQGSASPSSINLTADQVALATITYTLMQPTGKLAILLQTLPPELNGYSDKPVATVTQADTGSSVQVKLDWNASSIVSQLRKGKSYTFSTPTINYQGFQCNPIFNPTSLMANDSTLPATKLTYACRQLAQSTVTLNVKGAPSSLNSLRVVLTPNNNSAAVSQNVSLNNGSGAATVGLTTGTVYNVSADAVLGYSINFNPQPLTAAANAIETISLSVATPVSINGQLKVCGTQLCNKDGNPIQLKGMSSHGLQWFGLNKCLTTASLDALAKDFKASVLRVSLYVQEGGYETDPEGFTRQVNQLITEANNRGMYIIVDWHIMNPGDPNINLAKAQKFFTDIANANQDKVNLLYEIANEPNGVSWGTIKSYAEKLIPVIRTVDAKTVIIIGTPGWSSLGISEGGSSQDIINQPVAYPNIMYTFHFYAASHQDLYLNELDKASNVLPIFTTEWGAQSYDGDGANDYVMAEKYLQLMAKKKISWANWNYSDDFRSGAIWKTGICSSDTWTDSNLKPAGVWVKEKISRI